MKKPNIVEATIKVGDGVVTVRRKGVSTSVVAQILGREERDQIESITLDRLIHRQHETEIGSPDAVWSVGGAFVSVLSRRVGPQAIP